MSVKRSDQQYTDEEAQRRFEAALRGAREVGHEPMKDISPKRATPDSAMKLGKAKTGNSAPKRSAKKDAANPNDVP